MGLGGREKEKEGGKEKEENNSVSAGERGWVRLWWAGSSLSTEGQQDLAGSGRGGVWN